MLLSIILGRCSHYLIALFINIYRYLSIFKSHYLCAVAITLNRIIIVSICYQHVIFMLCPCRHMLLILHSWPSSMLCFADRLAITDLWCGYTGIAHAPPNSLWNIIDILWRCCHHGVDMPSYAINMISCAIDMLSLWYRDAIIMLSIYYRYNIYI